MLGVFNCIVFLVNLLCACSVCSILKNLISAYVDAEVYDMLCTAFVICYFYLFIFVYLYKAQASVPGASNKQGE